MLYICIFWLLYALSILVGVLCVESKSRFLPRLIPNLVLFGKVRKLRGNLSYVTDSLQCPKRWFWHFYLAGIIVTSSLLLVAMRTFLFTGEWPPFVDNMLNFLRQPGSSESDLQPPMSILISLVMMETQAVRRFLECVLVSSYSDSTMSVVIYATGVVYYMTIGPSALSLSEEGKLGTLSTELKWYHGVAVLLFIYSSWKQNKLCRILAKLRQDKHGNVENNTHHLPSGDLFELCSCPHYLMEIMIYAAICTVFLWQHKVCNCIFIFVLVNQTLAGILSHRWYKENFPSYPAHRKAVFPYLL